MDLCNAEILFFQNIWSHFSLTVACLWRCCFQNSATAKKKNIDSRLRILGWKMVVIILFYFIKENTVKILSLYFLNDFKTSYKINLNLDFECIYRVSYQFRDNWGAERWYGSDLCLLNFFEEGGFILTHFNLIRTTNNRYNIYIFY